MGKIRIGKKYIGIIAAAAAALLLAVFLLFASIREVTVAGNARYTSGELEEILFPDRLSRNTLYCYFRNRFRPHERIPFVEDYKIVFQSLTKVEVIVYEKSVVGYVSYMSSYMYFDKDGIIVESTNEKLPGVPWVIGLEFGQIVLYQRLPLEDERIFQEILNLTQILSTYGLDVDRIQYDSRGEATLYMGEVEVMLGGNESLNGKIAELNDMLPKLEGRSGTLHLENYDEANATAGHAFKPKK